MKSFQKTFCDEPGSVAAGREAPVSIVSAASDMLRSRGFELTQTLPVCQVTAKTEFRPSPPLTSSDTALLVGNTLSLWPHVAEHRQLHPGDAHPVDSYTERTVNKVADTFGATRVFLVHHRYRRADGAESWVPFQQLAVAAVMATLAPSHLCAHRTFGPWISFRALLLFATSSVLQPKQPVDTAPLLDGAPCADCEAPCVPAFQNAKAGPATSTRLRWLPVRDACPVGREYRFSETQIAHHYNAPTPATAERVATREINETSTRRSKVD